MIGYKIFVDRGWGWTGPHYQAQPNWKIKKGAVLKNPNGVDEDKDNLCSYGVNFYTSKKSAMEIFESTTCTIKKVVFKVQTMPDSIVVVPFFDKDDNPYRKARTDKLKLIERIAVFDAHKIVRKGEI